MGAWFNRIQSEGAGAAYYGGRRQTPRWDSREFVRGGRRLTGFMLDRVVFGSLCERDSFLYLVEVSRPVSLRGPVGFYSSS